MKLLIHFQTLNGRTIGNCGWMINFLPHFIMDVIIIRTISWYGSPNPIILFHCVTKEAIFRRKPGIYFQEWKYSNWKSTRHLIPIQNVIWIFSLSKTKSLVAYFLSLTASWTRVAVFQLSQYHSCLTTHDINYVTPADCYLYWVSLSTWS